MAMHMQPFLNTATELRERSDVPEEFVATLAAKGWPPLRSSTKLSGSEQHEMFLVEFSKEPPESLAPTGSHGGDRSSAVLHVIGAELGASPVFAADERQSATLIVRTLALASAAGATVPCVWLRGELAKRGALRRLSYVLMERLPAAAASPGLSLALPSTVPPSAIAGLAWYEDAATLVSEMRKLAIASGAAELDAPLAKLSEHCREACGTPAERRLVLSAPPAASAAAE